jgi:hypothetical protein
MVLRFLIDVSLLYKTPIGSLRLLDAVLTYCMQQRNLRGDSRP